MILPLLPMLVTILALIMCLTLAWNVGKARVKYGIKAPATTGNDDFERRFRAHANTVEMISLFIPALWIYAIIWHEQFIVSTVGGVWIAGRILYAWEYYKGADKRHLGFIISMFALIYLLAGSLIGIIKTLLHVFA